LAVWTTYRLPAPRPIGASASVAAEIAKAVTAGEAAIEQLVASVRNFVAIFDANFRGADLLRAQAARFAESGVGMGREILGGASAQRVRLLEPAPAPPPPSFAAQCLASCRWTDPVRGRQSASAHTVVELPAPVAERALAARVAYEWAAVVDIYGKTYGLDPIARDDRPFDLDAIEPVAAPPEQVTEPFAEPSERGAAA
jgi:hypothetical protein